jgi:tRNA(fMet)-specific endonuclease VapC
MTTWAGPCPLVLERLQTLPVSDVCMSVVTKAELLCGVELSPEHAQDAAALAAFLPNVEVLHLDEDAASHYAEIRADLKKRGAMIGPTTCSSRRTRVR